MGFVSFCFLCKHRFLHQGLLYVEFLGGFKHHPFKVSKKLWTVFAPHFCLNMMFIEGDGHQGTSRKPLSHVIGFN